MELRQFWNDREVLVTGHTGFKGSWLSLWLEQLGARVHGIALEPDAGPSMYRLAPLSAGDRSYIVDIRDGAALTKAVGRCRPEFVFHLAAQALVRRSYRAPAETYATNVGGTVNLLDAVLATESVKVVVVATTDKVYAETTGGVPYREVDALGGNDPYSSSKACTELVCRSYAHSFAAGRGIRLATARAGNVIGGGDWSEDRLVPDTLRAFEDGRALQLRYPKATRPWQHVLEPLGGYLAYAQALSEAGPGLPAAVNFGPDPAQVATVAQLADALGKVWGITRAWEPAPGSHPPEAAQLLLDSGLAASAIGWRPRLNLVQTIDWTCAWYRAWKSGADMRAFTQRQISDYEGMAA
ncbi:CDP-glucose 4,6-dehydratase [Mesorhizobium sp. CAU 1741]|uniref:CDP-glucose 4,6-dehydratase n=1 Tax=Mesorhizobium sp. CAU 1741 TaxID=3140366 RepID=UPI00325AADDB